MSIFQIIATLFALFMMYTVKLYNKKRALGAAETSFWFTVWTFFILVCLFPDLLKGISHTLHFSRVFDLLIVAALMVISFITFINYLRHKTLEQKIEDLVRKISFKKTKNVGKK